MIYKVNELDMTTKGGPGSGPHAGAGKSSPSETYAHIEKHLDDAKVLHRGPVDNADIETKSDPRPALTNAGYKQSGNADDKGRVPYSHDQHRDITVQKVPGASNKRYAINVQGS